MGKRIVTAVVLCAALLLALRSTNAWIYGGLLSLLLLAGVWEWGGLCRFESVAARVSYVLLLAALLAAARLYAWDSASFRVLMQAALCWWLLAFLWVTLAPGHVTPLTASVAGILALAPAWLALLRVATEWPHGTRWTLVILGIPVAMDTGGLFAGRSFGRTKLAPQVSPGKTWEGVLGGLALVALLAWFTRRWVSSPAAAWLTLCLAAAALSVVGDLTESLLKRAAGVKDSGRLFPGHGGALDRIDSIIAAAPVMTLGLIWLGVGP
jgi:phosphatidate cytidylyltransferase